MLTKAQRRWVGAGWFACGWCLALGLAALVEGRLFAGSILAVLGAANGVCALTRPWGDE